MRVRPLNQNSIRAFGKWIGNYSIQKKYDQSLTSNLKVETLKFSAARKGSINFLRTNVVPVFESEKP